MKNFYLPMEALSGWNLPSGNNLLNPPDKRYYSITTVYPLHMRTLLLPLLQCCQCNQWTLTIATSHLNNAGVIHINQTSSTDVLALPWMALLEFHFHATIIMNHWPDCGMHSSSHLDQRPKLRQFTFSVTVMSYLSSTGRGWTEHIIGTVLLMGPVDGIRLHRPSTGRILTPCSTYTVQRDCNKLLIYSRIWDNAHILVVIMGQNSSRWPFHGSDTNDLERHWTMNINSAVKIIPTSLPLTLPHYSFNQAELHNIE